MSSWAAPGVKCVCIVDEWAMEGHGQLAPGPQLNEICEVASGLIVDAYGECGIRLVGWDGESDLFIVSAFRPLITQQQDLALFTHILDVLPIREPA